VSLADLQTDHVGRYERKALLHARALQPDLVVFDGDYVQVGDPAERARQVGQLNALLREVGLKPRLGAFAVQGDVEWGYDDWPILFAGTGVHALPKTGVLDLGELELAGLTLHDSRVGCVLPLKKKFRVVFGHAPDFALRPPSGDLLLAGHTHGGQIQMPFFGPLITLSQVPRAWAGGGLVDLGAGRHLIVSRGIGRERGPAPQLRFNCRPEIVVIDLIPAEKETGSSSKEPR
jgi:predicted MPP superfamily phosphohydrolase